MSHGIYNILQIKELKKQAGLLTKEASRSNLSKYKQIVETVYR